MAFWPRRDPLHLELAEEMKAEEEVKEDQKEK